MKERYIYERKTKKGSLYYQVQITFKDAVGKNQTFYKSVYVDEYPSKSAALKMARAIRDEALYKIQNEKLIIDSPTVEQLFNVKFDYLKVAINTRLWHQRAYRKGICKLKDRKIKDISLGELQKNINDYAENNSDESIKKYVAVWVSLYKTAMLLGYNVTDYTRLVIRPKSKKVHVQKKQTISYEDFIKIVDCLSELKSSDPKKQHRYRSIWYSLLIGYYTGLRPAEIRALNAEDIQDDGIHVTKQVGSSATQKVAIVPPKTQSSYRVVPIPAPLHPILKMLKDERQSSPLLAELDGTLLDSAQVVSVLLHVKRKIGIDFHPYMLRHVMATDLVKSRASDRAIQDLLGHKSYSMSLEYARSNPEERDEIMQDIRTLKS